MDFNKAVSGVGLPNVLDRVHWGSPQGPVVEAPKTTSGTQETQSVRTAAVDTRMLAADGPAHPLLGVSTAILETQEFFNAVIFVSTGVFLLFVADAFAQVGRRQARMDAMAELLRAQMARS